MPFIPHTEEDIQSMLSTIGVESIEQLFDEIPATLRVGKLDDVPEGRSEMEVSRLIGDLAERDHYRLSFLGAGAYEHHIPAAVWQITTRGEFYSAYTPYQAEASQGTLQLIYEYQTMMCRLTSMDVSNASMYDGASAMGEAVLMAVRGNRKAKTKRILMASTVHPLYQQTAKVIVGNQGIEFESLPFDASEGRLDPAALEKSLDGEFAALVIAQPNFFGTLEQVDALTDWAHSRGAMVIAVANPTSLALLKPPGEWGTAGADIVCGEGQPLGIPLSSGGPYFGYMCCKKPLMRQMPGRIVGCTTDLEGKTGYALTLQAREQHIRRSKATSNICTNQGLMVTAATIYMSLVGDQGLKKIAATSHQNTRYLSDQLQTLSGVEALFNSPFFHETVFSLDQPVAPILQTLEAQGILAGLDLSEWFPELGHAVLICATETKTKQDIDSLVKAFSEAMSAVA